MEYIFVFCMKYYYIYNKKNNMRVFILLLVIISFQTFGQVNLGKVYFRHPQYLLSFDRVLYPNKSLNLENIRFTQYMKGVKVMDRNLPTRSIYPIDVNYYELFDRLDVGDPAEPSVSLNMNISLNEDLDISNEFYEVSVSFRLTGEEVGLSAISGNSNLIKRAKNNQVEEIRVTNEIDVETNEWSTREEVLSTRPLNKNEVADMHGNIYNTVKIGDQVWMSENLRSTAFNDGTELTVLNEKQWANTSGPGLVKENSEGNYYNFYTLLSDKNICPQGFRVPDEFDIENLYNEITPYDEQIKISSSGVVKRKVYAPLLAPIVMPVSAAVHLAWWGIGTGLSGAAIGTVAVLDAAYLLPWTALDLLVVGPIAGWSTKNKKRKHAYRQALSNSEYVDTLGYSLKLNRKGKWVRISMIPKEKWGEFKLAAVSKDSTTVTEISDPQARSRMQREVADAEYHLTYKAFPTLKFKPFLSAFLFDDLLGSMSEVFYQKLMAFSPWREVTSKDYPNKLFRTETFNFNYQPVLTQLLAQGENAEFSDLYRYSLNFNNTIGVPNERNFKAFRSREFITGISYNLNGSPGVWGLNRKSRVHELTIMQEAYRMAQGDELYRLSTRVRCVSTNSSNK